MRKQRPINYDDHESSDRNDLQATVSEEKYVPLKEVTIEGNSHSFAADVTIDENFVMMKQLQLKLFIVFQLKNKQLFMLLLHVLMIDKLKLS